MAQSQQRSYTRSLSRAQNNPTQAKIMARYFNKQEEYKKLNRADLDVLAEQIMKKEVKLSNTDKQAFYDVYRPLVFQEAMDKYKQQQEEKQKELNKTQENVNNEGETQPTQDIQS